MKIGIDLGGTNIRIALVDKGQIIKRASQLCNSQEAKNVIIDQIKDLIRQMLNPSVTGIGIGVPSVVDPAKGIVYNVANIPSWKEVHLKTILEEEFNIPVKLNNDCNCFVLGEHYFGEGKRFSDLVGVTLGTGLGCGIVINKDLYNGSNTGAGEISELPYLEHTYEYYCSTPFFAEVNHVSAIESAQKAAQGDEEALRLWSEFGRHLAEAIKLIVLTYDPPCIVLGGSIANAMSYFETAMHEGLKDFAYPNSIDRLIVYRSEVEDVAILGATML